jgi:hypothetical protein
MPIGNATLRTPDIAALVGRWLEGLRGLGLRDKNVPKKKGRRKTPARLH